MPVELGDTSNLTDSPIEPGRFLTPEFLDVDQVRIYFGIKQSCIQLLAPWAESTSRTTWTSKSRSSAPPGLLEGQQYKQEQLEEAHRDRMEADQRREQHGVEDMLTPTARLDWKAIIPEPMPLPPAEAPDPHRGQLKQKFPDITEEIGEIYAELTAPGVEWKAKAFEKRVGDAQHRFWKRSGNGI
jgi:hypothetical protein